jgi:flagellar hook protein FlgE
MLSSLSSGVSGIQAFQEEMDVISNNIANVNTPGYKSSRADFADAFSQTLRGASGASGTAGATPAIQVGSGVMVAGVTSNFSSGSLATTGYQTDLAINGEGFFTVRDPVSGAEFATRAGDFKMDSNGYLTTQTGLRVQGYSDGTLSTIGDLKIDATGRPATSDPAATYAGFTVSPQGMIDVHLSDSTDFTRGQILLQTFSDEQALVKEGLNLYSGMGAAGGLATAAPPQTNGMGKIQSGALEASNVDLANEFATMITTQRAFQANARIITTSDEMLQELVNLKR